MRILFAALFSFFIVAIFTKTPDLFTQFVWGAMAAVLALVVCSLALILKRSAKRTTAQQWTGTGLLAAGVILLTLSIQYTAF